GVLDTTQAAEVTATLLSAVVAKKARFVIIDVTGIDVMDTRAADHFLRMARAVRLLGSAAALSGTRPTMASATVHLGVEMEGGKTYRSMRDALQDDARHATKSFGKWRKPCGQTLAVGTSHAGGRRGGSGERYE